MNITIDKKSRVPIYIQIKNQIMNEIKQGTLKIGDKMPTERDLSQSIGVSRNTISTVYNLLVEEGVLISYQGRGTFVAEEAKPWTQNTIRDKLLKIVDLGLEEAFELGLDAKEYLALVNERIEEKEKQMKSTKAVFVECNIEQSREFSKELAKYTNMNVVPLVLSDILNRDEKTIEAIRKAQLIITPFNHVNDVKNSEESAGKEIVGIAINPSLETIVRIARYPSSTSFGLVCISKEFQFKVENALKSSGLKDIKINATISKNDKEVIETLSGCDVIIVSPGRREDVLRLTKGTKEVISFDYNIDKDSVKAVLTKTMEMENE